MTDRDTPQPEHGQDIETLQQLSPEEIIGLILPRGHVINGYSSTSNERVIKIVPDKNDTSDEAPLLGFGVSGDAEVALGRALATYIQRERDGLATIEPTTYPHLTEGREFGGGHRSRFDNIVWGDDVTIFQDGDEVAIHIRYAIYGPSIFKAPTLIEAITLLTDQYHYGNAYIASLPSVSWIPKSTVVKSPEALDI